MGFGDYSNERADNRDLINERKVVDSNHEKPKLQTFAYESPVENRVTKYLDQEGRKRFVDDSKTTVTVNLAVSRSSVVLYIEKHQVEIN